MTDQKVLKQQEQRQLALRSMAPGGLVIGTGAFLLAANLFGFSVIDFVWPAFILAPGLLFLWPASMSTPEKRNSFSFLAVPGAMMVVTAVLLFVMNLTDHFEAWAYSWPLVIAAAIYGVSYILRFEHERRFHTFAERFVRGAVLAFGGLAVFFEIIIFENFNPLLPLALIGYGVYMLMRNRREQAELNVL